MKGEALKRKMIDNKDVWYFIFEEMSLIDRMLFACTDLRSQDIYESKEVFAQRNVMTLDMVPYFIRIWSRTVTYL